MQKTDPHDWPTSSARTITIVEPADGYKAPLGFDRTWETEKGKEEPSNDQPSTGSGGSE